MRLFVGVVLPKEIKDELFSVHSLIKGNVAKVNWVSKKNLHITLKFLGNVEEREIPGIVERLKKVKFNSFEAKIGELRDFSRSRRAKVMWVGLTPEKEVIGLQQKVDSELLDLFGEADQKFSPHLTLGRVKLIKKPKEFSESVKDIKIKPLSFSIDAFYLIESRLTKDGPVYGAVEVFKPSNL